MRPTKGTLNIGLSMTVLILFVIIIFVGWVYVSRTDDNVKVINATLNKVNTSLNHFQFNSNHRWNVTFAEFNRVSHAIDQVADRLSDNQVKNLNLTKFNRAALLDTNIMTHKLWEQLTGVNPCKDNPLAMCVDPNMNITNLVLNATRAQGGIDAPKPVSPK